MGCRREGSDIYGLTMADHELTSEEGLRLFNEIFGSEDAAAPPTHTCRKYVLEYHGEPIFQLAEMQRYSPAAVPISLLEPLTAALSVVVSFPRPASFTRLEIGRRAFNRLDSIMPSM